MKEKVSIDKFCNEVLNSNAPLTYGNFAQEDAVIFDEINNIRKSKGIFYPYKPFLILAILQSHNFENIFNIEINISNIKIVKRFYDLITNDLFLFTILKYQKSKFSWEFNLGLNNSIYSEKLEVYKSVLSIIKQSPFKAMSNHQCVDKLDANHIRFNVEINNWQEDKKYLISRCCEIIKKCIPWYSYLNESELGQYDFNFDLDIQDMMLSREMMTEVKVRKFQHRFRKLVLDRDLKCCICCTDNYVVLDACHIKPYSACKDDEAYDENNGIVMCKNHHKLFDSGLFTFNNEWKVVVSKWLSEIDTSLYFKQYEKCYTVLSSKMPFENEFVNYHNKLIFRK